MRANAYHEASVPEADRPSHLHLTLAARILRSLKEQNAQAGHHLVELELCDQFGVSRTPIRGALRVLAKEGIVEARANRGYILIQPVTDAPETEMLSTQRGEDQRLFEAIASAYAEERLPSQCAQQELVRMFDAKLTTVARVMQKLADVGIAQRKPGNGWAFISREEVDQLLHESEVFRGIIEASAVMLPSFKADHAQLRSLHERHVALQRQPAGNNKIYETWLLSAELHNMLAMMSGNSPLAQAVSQQTRIVDFLKAALRFKPAEVDRAVSEHIQVIGALMEGDNSRAARTLRQHFTFFRDQEAYHQEPRQAYG
jgi:DNA-binding GntR family transcriptional regulator